MIETLGGLGWIAISAFVFANSAPEAVVPNIPLYGLFETEVINSAAYDNPFADVELNAVFASPSGRQIGFFGFYDGDAEDARNGSVWKQRFMPDEVGAWTYTLTFSDGQPGKSGSFQCVGEDAKPGPWRQDPDNARWFRTANGDHFLPVAMFANCVYTPIDWQDAVEWCKAMGFNTLITRTFNHYVWGDGWKNVTCFATANAAKKEVNYDRMNLDMWREWDQMIQHAGESGIYIGSFEGPCGKYGGQWRGKYPPPQLVMNPGIRDRFDTQRNLKVIRYLVARQGAFWNLAYWSLGNTEVYAYAVEDEKEFLEYGEYFASITPWRRMITGQDAEQWHGENRRWMSKLNIPASRKLNTVQTAVRNPNRPSWGGSNIDDPAFQNAKPNNELALDSYGGFPVLTTEGLWEGQGRATKPLRIIWGFFTAGAHTMWADWNYEHPDQHDFGSIGRGWAPPVKPMDRHQFHLDQLGVNCVGDEQLKIATDAMNDLNYWKMTPHNDLVADSTEAYCLAEPGAQYVVYAPNGGAVKLDLSDAHGAYSVKWLDPRTGDRLDRPSIQSGAVCTLDAPDAEDWVLFVTKR